MVVSRFPTIPETFVLNEILELRRQGVDVQVYSLIHERKGVVHPSAVELDRDANYVRVLSAETLRAQAHWLRRSPRRYLRLWWDALTWNARSPKFLSRALYAVPVAAAFALRMERGSVTHIHAHFATHPTLAAWAASRLTGIPYSFTAHAHDIYIDRTMLDRKLREGAFTRTISAYNKALLERLYGPDAAGTHVIHCGVDVAEFAKSNREGGDPFTIVCVASLKPFKGHRYLIDALGLLAKTGTEFNCVLVGEGESRGDIEAQIEALGLGEQVDLTGARTSGEVRAILTRADLAAHVSIVEPDGRMDGIPVALMEAMATGLPVVASDVSGIAELVEDGRNGILVPQRDPVALAAAIRDLAEDPVRRRSLGEEGARHVAESFELSHNTERLRRLMADAGHH